MHTKIKSKAKPDFPPPPPVRRYSYHWPINFACVYRFLPHASAIHRFAQNFESFDGELQGYAVTRWQRDEKRAKRIVSRVINVVLTCFDQLSIDIDRNRIFNLQFCRNGWNFEISRQNQILNLQSIKVLSPRFSSSSLL